MNETIKAATGKMYHALDGMFARLRRDEPEKFNPPCKAGCFWCCYEGLYASANEVDYMLDGVPLEDMDRLTTAARNWLTRAQEAGVLSVRFDDSLNLGMNYRRANIPCPFLVEGKCSAYDRRPIGCRVFFAHSHPENCAMPMREHQKFAQFPHPSPIDYLLAEHILACGGDVYMDHLGVLLANKLLGLNLKSAAGQAYRIEAAPETQTPSKS